jgi:hypothetical protein
MKAGINIWRALRDVKDVHPACAHIHETTDMTLCCVTNSCLMQAGVGWVT